MPFEKSLDLPYLRFRGLQSRWDVQSLAGAIIPAIATTNAMVAGLQTMHFLKILRNRKAPLPSREQACSRAAEGVR